MSDAIERIRRRIIETSAELIEATVTDTIIPLDEALAVIDEESAKEPQECKWVPCSKRLPEENGHYLVTYHCKSYGNYLPLFDDVYVRKMRFQNNKWMLPFNLDKEAREDEFQEVIAWMNLPPIYEN